MCVYLLRYYLNKLKWNNNIGLAKKFARGFHITEESKTNFWLIQCFNFTKVLRIQVMQLS